MSVSNPPPGPSDRQRLVALRGRRPSPPFASAPPRRPSMVGADHLRGDQQICARPAPEVEDRLALLSAAVGPGVRDPGEAVDSGVGYTPELGLGVAELLGPSPARWEDEVSVLLGRDLGVGLLDLRAQDLDVDRCLGGHGGASYPVPRRLAASRAG